MIEDTITKDEARQTLEIGAMLRFGDRDEIEWRRCLLTTFLCPTCPETHVAMCIGAVQVQFVLPPETAEAIARWLHSPRALQPEDIVE